MVLSLLALSPGHAALSFPRPRNALDGALDPWSNWSYPCDATHRGDACAITFCENGKKCAGSCPIQDAKGGLNASNGQSCYWFSNGCTVGCERCDGTSNHVGHGNQTFVYRGRFPRNSAQFCAILCNSAQSSDGISTSGMSPQEVTRRNLTIEPWAPAPGDMVLNATTAASVEIKPNCAAPHPVYPRLCDPRARTANTQAECGGKDDLYFFSPWRAPGAAPVIDSCGVAGGRHPGQGIGGAGASFENTSVARQGDRGSALPPMAPQATWRAGALAEVGWTVMANHGGGYAYRLAPAGGPLTEETFGRTPLDFEGRSALRWDGDASTQLEFDTAARGWEVREGTVPAGSAWRKNPIPSGLWAREGPQFAPVCDESDECKAMMSQGNWASGFGSAGTCKCSGFSNGGPLLPNLEVVDRVRIPAGLAPGRWVLQWRWDCEESDQVWMSCADVEIASG